MPAITVIVPTRNRPELLAGTLASLVAQTGVELEVIVVDDGSDPPAIAPEGVKVIRHDQPRGPNAARNTGAREAQAELVWFVDDDIDAPPGWASAVVDGASSFPDGWGFGGPIRLRLEGTTRRRCDRCGGGWETELDLGRDDRVVDAHLYGANMGATREALSRVPFDASLPIHFEEIEWQESLRAAGGKMVYLADAWLWHKRTGETATLPFRLSRAFKQGRGAARFHLARGQRITWLDTGPPHKTLVHAVRRRCQTGYVLVAIDAGRLVGAIDFKLRRRLGRHPG